MKQKRIKKIIIEMFSTKNVRTGLFDAATVTPSLSSPPLLSPVAFSASHLKIFEIGIKKKIF